MRGFIWLLIHSFHSRNRHFVLFFTICSCERRIDRALEIQQHVDWMGKSTTASTYYASYPRLNFLCHILFYISSCHMKYMTLCTRPNEIFWQNEYSQSWHGGFWAKTFCLRWTNMINICKVVESLLLYLLEGRSFLHWPEGVATFGLNVTPPSAWRCRQRLPEGIVTVGLKRTPLSAWRGLRTNHCTKPSYERMWKKSLLCTERWKGPQSYAWNKAWYKIYTDFLDRIANFY